MKTSFYRMGVAVVHCKRFLSKDDVLHLSDRMSVVLMPARLPETGAAHPGPLVLSNKGPQPLVRQVGRREDLWLDFRGINRVW